MARTRHPSLVIGVLAFCGTVVAVMQTLVIPLLPIYPELLGTSAANVTWLVTAPLVAGAVCAPMLGRLGDMYGKRRMLVVALGVMTTGSLIGGITDQFSGLLVARTLQGTAIGVIPLGISILRDLLPAGRIGSGVGLISSTFGIGGAIGLPVAGLVAAHASWHWLFLGAGVLGILQITLVLLVVPESEVRSGGRFDVIGAVGLSAGLLGLMLVISRGNSWGWTSPTTLALVAGALVVFPVWGLHQLRASNPFVNLRLSARPAVLLTNLASLLIGFGLFAAFIVSAPMLQAPAETGYGFELSPATAGFCLLPLGLSMAVFSQVSARISARRGARATLLLGAAVIIVGNVARAFVPSQLLLAVLSVTVVAIGAALAYSALPTLMMESASAAETAAANSVNTLMRTIGTSGCSAAIAALTTAHTTDVGGRTWPSDGSYTTVFLLAAVAGVGALLLALVNPSRRAARPAVVREPATAHVDAGSRPSPMPARMADLARMGEAAEGGPATRLALPRAARRRFPQHDYTDVTQRDIAADGGVSAALAVKCFTSKEDLYAEAVSFEADVLRLLDGPLDRLGKHLMRTQLSIHEAIQGDSAASKRSSPLDQPNGMVLDAEGNLYIGDIASSNPGFDPGAPRPVPSAVYCVACASIDVLASGLDEQAAQGVQRIVMHGAMNGVAISPGDGCCWSVSCSRLGFVHGGGIYRLTDKYFRAGIQPESVNRGLGVRDGIGLSRRSTVLASNIRTGEIHVSLANGTHLLIRIPDSRISMPADCKLVCPTFLAGDPALLVPDIDASAAPVTRIVVVIGLADL